MVFDSEPLHVLKSQEETRSRRFRNLVGSVPDTRRGLHVPWVRLALSAVSATGVKHGASLRELSGR